ncbi:heavy metal translocating P-type ATPase [Mycoplasmatota bacterium WC44]
MKYKIIMEGLVCTGCAGKIETAINKLDFIEVAEYNLVSQTMSIETNKNVNDVELLKTVTKIVDANEDGVTVYYKNHIIKKKKSLDVGYLLMGIGLIIFMFGVFYNISYLFYLGYIFFANKIIKKSFVSLKNKSIFDENTLMFIATVAAMYIGEYYEAIAVLLFYTVGEYFQNRAVKKSKGEIENLISLKIDSVTVLKGIKKIIKTPEELTIGEVLLIKVGDQVPVDAKVVKGNTNLDTSAMNGESKPTFVSTGDEIISGCINLSNVIEVEVVRTFENSTLSKVIELIENSTLNKSNTEMFITKFAKYYTPFVTLTALLLVAIPTLINVSNFNEYLSRGAVFLVISCPCALVLSIPLSYFAGIGKSASEHVLFKGSNFLESLTNVSDIFTDKTGTLTHGNFKVSSYTSKEVLHLAASIEEYSNHPVAEAIKEENKHDVLIISDIQEVAGMGVTGKYKDQQLIVGNDKLMEMNDITVKEISSGTVIHVALNKEYLGFIIITDQLKESSVTAINELIKMNINVHMLTGDNESVASEISKKLGINYYSSLLPEEKVNIVKNYESKGNKLFVGDGINDAPALANVDIGVSMGKKGSDLAIEVADVIVMDDNLTSLVKSIKISKVTKSIVIQNIIFALGIKVLFLILGGFGVTTMWMAIFSDVGVSLLAVLNALRILYKKYEGVIA